MRPHSLWSTTTLSFLTSFVLCPQPPWAPLYPNRLIHSSVCHYVGQLHGILTLYLDTDKSESDFSLFNPLP
jgi:hypothetical protein